IVLQLLVQRGKFDARPEALLEGIGVGTRSVERPALLENDGPGRYRGEQQQQHHQLHDEAGIENELNDRKIRIHGFSLSRMNAGMARGRKLAAPRQATLTRPSASISPSLARRTNCSKISEVLPCSTTRAPISSRSSRRAGRR